MQCELLMIGTEMLLGQIQDTNATFMGRVLAENGIGLYQKTTVGDNPRRIGEALLAALERSDVVLTSGGLGPTEDDITRECIAETLGHPLEFRQDLYDTLVERFARNRFVLTENNKKQAYAPQGARSIPNPNGTAPGIIVEDARGTVVAMPAVPGELMPMMTDSVLPYLREKFNIHGIIHSRVLKVCGIGESRVDAAISDLMRNQSNPTVGVLAYPDSVQIRITARATSQEEAETLIDAVDVQVRDRLPGLIMGTNDATIERAVDALLTAREWTLGVAEEATGGTLTHRLNAAGAQSLAGALVIRRDAEHGGNLEALARGWAEHARAEFSASCGLALLAAPEAGITQVCLVTPDEIMSWPINYLGTGERAHLRTTIVSLEHVRRHLLGVTTII